MEISGEALLSAYERLREIPEHTKVEILAEWEMFSRFGEAADHVWLLEFGKAEERIRQRYVRTLFRPNANAALMVGDIWFFANIAGGLHNDDALAHLCPYNCETHAVSKGA